MLQKTISSCVIEKTSAQCAVLSTLHAQGQIILLWTWCFEKYRKTRIYPLLQVNFILTEEVTTMWGKANSSWWAKEEGNSHYVFFSKCLLKFEFLQKVLRSLLGEVSLLSADWDMFLTSAFGWEEYDSIAKPGICCEPSCQLKVSWEAENRARMVIWYSGLWRFISLFTQIFKDRNFKNLGRENAWISAVWTSVHIKYF